jgi:hypothetical protein
VWWWVLLAIDRQNKLGAKLDHKLVWRAGTIISNELAAVIDRMVCPQVIDRYQSVAEVLADLAQLPAPETLGGTSCEQEKQTHAQSLFLKLKSWTNTLIKAEAVGSRTPIK